MTDNKAPCYVCEWQDKNPVLYGKFLTTPNVSSHYFCMLSGTNIPQTAKKRKKNGGSDPLLGFTHGDILDSKIFYAGVKCYYCGKKSAAVNCAHKGCERSFHYPCGTRNSCMTVFRGEFLSYCNRHVPEQNEGKKHTAKYCLVCYELLQSYHPADSIISSCCLELDDWEDCFLHKKCVMQYAQNAGYDSMCINCPMKERSKEDWQNEMRDKGIFIPMKDAAWEQDGRFQDQVKNKCEMPGCSKAGAKSKVYTCFVCGCYPRHLSCAKVESFEDYNCPECYDQSFVQRVPRLA